MEVVDIACKTRANNPIVIMDVLPCVGDWTGINDAVGIGNCRDESFKRDIEAQIFLIFTYRRVNHTTDGEKSRSVCSI
jgi:hypothetical protein